MRDGQKDTVCNMVKVTDLLGGKHFVRSSALRIVDPEVVKTFEDEFEGLIYKSFPVWLGHLGYVVKKGGSTSDINLFKAVMTGH